MDVEPVLRPEQRHTARPDLDARNAAVAVGALVDEAAFMDGHTQFGQLEEYVKATAEVCARHGVAFEAPHFLSPLSMYPAAGKLCERDLEYLRARGVACGGAR